MRELFEWDNNWKFFGECGEAAPWKNDTQLELSVEEIEDFKEVCKSCQVSEECLESAFVTRQYLNIWGGMTATERYQARQ